MMEKIIIPIQTETERFFKHIDTSFNNRIFFSGIFGIGKTYFLREFFTKHQQKYDAYFVSPVNYSIASNKDIFKYIKFDIAFELLSKQEELDENSYTLRQTLPFFIKENKLDILKTILKNAGTLGKGLKEITELAEKAVKHNKDINKNEIISYLNSVSEMDGSIYDNALITELLSEKIQQAKIIEEEEKEGETIQIKKKKAVLIIDDLDRLDPEHIFRILNVLAHQVDMENMADNLFSFDKIIIVGDVDNIRSIFHTKYGEKTNFSGYIDKFFDNEVYAFDNKEFINEKIDEILKNIKLTEQSKRYINLQNREHVIHRLLRELLIILINNNLLNLRSLLKYQEQPFEFDVHNFSLKDRYTKSAWTCEFGMIVIFNFLLKLYGEMSALENAVQRLSEKDLIKMQDDNFEEWYGFLIPLINYEKLSKYNSGQYNYKNTELNLDIAFSIERWGSDIRIYFARIIKIDSGMKENYNLSYGKLLKIAFEKYKEIKNNKA